MNPSIKRNRIFRRHQKVSADDTSGKKKDHAKKDTKVFHDEKNGETKKRKPVREFMKDRWKFFCEEMARNNGGQPTYLAGPLWCAAPYYPQSYNYNEFH